MAPWRLGARPNNSYEKFQCLVEEIITCMNVHESSAYNTRSSRKANIYVEAYKELTWYLRYLFIQYDKLLPIEELIEPLKDWKWAEFIKKVLEESDKITFVTYNYDLWLEKILQCLDIPFSYGHVS